MSAAHPASPARVQAPAPSAAPTFASGLLKVTGILLDHAEQRHTPGHDSHALLVARISTGAGMPYEAVHDLGSSPASHIAAESKARLLRRGTAVSVTCRGALPRTDHAHAVLRCLDVVDLIPLSLPTTPGQAPD